MDKRILNYLVIIFLTLFTFTWTFWIFHRPFVWTVVVSVIVIRLIASTVIFKDFSLSWSKSTPKSFLIKSAVYLVAFAIYMPIFHGEERIAFFVSELFFYLFLISFLMYSYYYFTNKSKIEKTKKVVIYGAGRAGLQVEEELVQSEYKVLCFVDDAPLMQRRSIDALPILSEEQLKEKTDTEEIDLLVIAMPSASPERIREIYEEMHGRFGAIKILPGLDEILLDSPMTKQLKNMSVEDLLARRPKDLDKERISSFIHGKKVLVTGAGGSIGSEIVRQCIRYGADQLILVDHSEYNLYQIEQEVAAKADVVCVMQSVVDKERLDKTFERYRPEIVIHAAAYKHVPMVEANIEEGILNNVIGTKNTIDAALKYHVKKFVLISTDKAVRPTNVMGATKRITELYAQNVPSGETEIVAVRFGNVLGSSGSVIPKFKAQIEAGGPITVTDPEITRYFMLIPEACELVLQAGAIGKGGEIFILDMGEPIKIVDLAKKMIELSGRDDIEIEYTGLRPGEKLYEELLIDESDASTEYESITVAAPTPFAIEKLQEKIRELLSVEDKLKVLREIVPEFNHQTNQ